MTPPRRPAAHGILLVAMLSLTAGCVTRAQVQRIVTDSNAAMVSSYLNPGATPEGEVQDAVAAIDQLIESHPDNAVMVNHLRVRQAMLLGVHGKRTLADLRWDTVDAGRLKTERDRSLAACGKHLAWWYETAGTEEDDLDASEASAALERLDATINDTTSAGSDIRIYLATIRAQIELRRARDADPQLDSDKDALRTELVVSLEKYIEAIGADATWLMAELDGADENLAMQIKEFRHGIQLKGLIREYKALPGALDIAPPERWRPGWVEGVD